MNKLLKRILTSATLAVTLLAPMAVPAIASAASHTLDLNKGLCAGASFDVSGDCPDPGNTDSKDKLNNLIRQVINIFSIIVGLVSVIMIIVAGLKYITSGGASDKVTGAKDTILYAVIGLVIVGLAQTIVFFVLGQTAKV